MTAAGPYRSRPRLPTDVRVVRLKRPGAHGWSLPLAIPLLALVASFVASYASVKVECDLVGRTCLVVEHRLALTHSREISGVIGVHKDTRGRVELVTDRGTEPLLRWSFMGPAYNVVDEFVGEFPIAIEGCPPSRRHVDANLVPDPGTFAWMFPLGALALVLGIAAFANGLAYLRGVPLRLDLSRRALAIPRLGLGIRPRELPMDGIADVTLRRDRDAPARSPIAMFVVLQTGESIPVTPIGTDTVASLEPSRRALAEALGVTC